jgi:class 3 adenylate cyclase
MVHAPDAVDAVGLALDAVSNAEERGLWALHAGVNAGRMVRRDGDFYGTAVNIASRVAGEAGPGEVVVTGTIAEGWTGDDDVEFHPLGEVALKNVGAPVALYQAMRRS